MKTLSVPKPVPAGARRARRAQAFTLAEMMVAVFIFVFMVLGIIYAWMFGMRYDELVCSKLGASDKSRMSFDLLTGDIRSAKWWKVGNWQQGTTSFHGLRQCHEPGWQRAKTVVERRHQFARVRHLLLRHQRPVNCAA